jgi:hypothetical protein
LNTSTSVDQITVGHIETTTPVIKSGAIMIMHGQTPITCAAPTFVVDSLENHPLEYCDLELN